MSQIVDDLRQVAIEIKTETQVGGNTAARVGGAFERVADALEGTQQIEDMDAAVAAVQQAAAENEQTIQDIVNSLAVVQTTGQSTSDVMSQKAVTDELNTLSTNLQDVEGEINDINIKTANDANTDLDIADEYGDVLVRFANGHVQTKNFNSREIKIIVDNAEFADLNVADESGNVVLSVADGHIRTKNFDSSNIELDKYAKKKTIKYLAIGNSVNQDPACYIPYLLRKLYGDDIDFEIGVAYHGSYTIKDYVELMITGQENLETFSYAKNIGRLTNISNVPLSYAVGYADWDIVSFEAYQTDMAGSGRTEDVTLAPELLDWLKQHTKDGCRFGLITPATYTDVRDLYVGWQQDILTSCSLDYLLDYGATKEFLIAKGFVNSDLSPLENGRYIHSKEGFPCEALALTAIHFFADIAKIDDKASNLLVQITEAEHDALNVPQQNGTYTSTTEENWRKCVDAALDGWRVSLASYAISNNTLRDNTFTNI